MFELNGYQLPDFPSSGYPYAMISFDSSGGCAYLTFVDKVGYIKKNIIDNVWYGNAYTLGLTTDMAHDESRVIYEESYVVMLDEAYKDALELLYPGINKTSWLRYTPSSKQTPSGGYYSLAMNYGPQWANFTLYDEDGNLFLSAEKKFPLREWIGWLLAGLCSRPVPVSVRNKAPVAYLYNGMRLPDINAVWTDKETYPYAYINAYSNMLYITTVALTNTEKYGLYLSGSHTWRSYQCYTLDYLREVLGLPELTAEEVFNETGIVVDVWQEFEWSSSSGGRYVTWEIGWASDDILNEDGTVYLAASDPVPVYE